MDSSCETAPLALLQASLSSPREKSIHLTPPSHSESVMDDSDNTDATGVFRQ
uniref:Uncharacterized protein n=1 Tax=Oryza sativa subsp. japonica TaxID=39947 RepID=Q6H417_ORYSJ|nr:hypothetical protein [Oryza sativa Japonica Group]